MELDHDSARLIISTISASWSWIGGDLWLLIFYRLPIETLCRFRCVCKSWNSLISSPFFINLHHSFNSSATPPNLKPYLLFNVGRSPNCYSLYRPQSETLTEHLRRELYFPFRFWKQIDCVDVVRGVVCASYSVDSSFDSTILWNPAIRKYVALPRRPYPSHPAPSKFSHINRTFRFYTFAIGVGYDRSKNDFKVVRIRILATIAPTYEVYSAREGLWREGIIAGINLTSCKFDPKTSRTGCFVNGTIHWPLPKPSGPGISDILYSVLMFDCELEQFTTMELPREIYKPTMRAIEEFMEVQEYQPELAFLTLVDMTRLELLEYTGLLSVLVSQDEGCSEHYVDLWVMQEHGVASTWQKLYRIHDGDELGIEICRPSFGNRAPFGPNQWIKFHDIKSSDLILRGCVYEESMFFMDDTKGQSYTAGEKLKKKPILYGEESMFFMEANLSHLDQLLNQIP